VSVDVNHSVGTQRTGADRSGQAVLYAVCLIALLGVLAVLTVIG
jgi:hypothetical protein